MTEEKSFVERIRERYPEGLTAVVPIGGTRTMYILDKQRHHENPGEIADFADHADYLLEQYFALIQMFFDLGGQNIIIPILAYDRFTAYGTRYAGLISDLTQMLIRDQAVKAYREKNIDPYFLGTDTLVKLPADHPGHGLGQALRAFQASWDYQAGRRKVFWEIAGLPLYSMWNSKNVMPPEEQAKLEAEIEATNDIEKVRHLAYNYYSKALYGTELPLPHFYLGCNRNGDLKVGSALSTTLTWGFMCRMFFVPYSTMFITRETLQTIIEDVAFGKLMRSKTADYDNRYTSEMAQAEYERMMELRADPMTTVGLSRQVLAGTPDLDA
jgi:hypothetical protein